MSDLRGRTVTLIDEELALLDGRCRPVVQALVDAAKSRMNAVAAHAELPGTLASLIADVVSEARTNGELVFYTTNITHCPTCGRNDGYWLYTRSSRNHRKGDKDYNKPKRFGGVEMARRFVTMQNHVTLGCCTDCFARVQPALATALADVEAAIPEKLSGHPPRFKKYDNRECTKCGWIGHDGQMGQERTLMGDGYYPASCPRCKAGGGLFNRDVKILDGFTVCRLATPMPPERAPVPAVDFSRSSPEKTEPPAASNHRGTA